MGTDNGTLKPVEIDFHGLHVNEAKNIAIEYIKPILPVLKKIRIITGRGAHSKNGQGKLNEAIKKFFLEELNIKCKNVFGNEGALDVFFQ